MKSAIKNTAIPFVTWQSEDWIQTDEVLLIHEDMIRRYGGASGVRDQYLLESALARPKNISAYMQDVDLCSLAAAYGFGIAKNHPFIDGNKRTAFATMLVFLKLHGHRLTAPQPEATRVMTELAAGEFAEEELAAWLRKNVSAV